MRAPFVTRWRTQLVTCLVWLLGILAYAVLYVHRSLAMPGLQGYETQWTTYVLFFVIFKFPYFVMGLIATLLFESWWQKRTRRLMDTRSQG